MPRTIAKPPEGGETRSDLALVAAIRRGDRQAFDALYDRYFQRVFNFAYSRLRNRADAEEVAQDTFTVVFRSIEAFKGQSSLLSWIYGIARNTVNNQIRRSRAHEQRVERAQVDVLGSGRVYDAFTPEDRLSFRRCADKVEEALTSVTSWQAEVFLMRHFDNMPIQEIADRTSRSNDAIRSSLYRVKRLVVEAIDGELSSAG